MKKIALLGGDLELAQSLQNLVEGLTKETHFQHVLDGTTEINRLQPDLLVFKSPKHEAAVEGIQQILAANPSVLIFYVSDRSDFYGMREVIRAGASDYFVLPDEFPLLESAIEKAIQQMNLQDAQSVMPSFKKGRGRVISFYSGKGGSGTTLISSSFAQTLRLESTARVLFVDLNLQYGGAECFLGIESDRSLADLQTVIDEVNDGHIRNVAQKEKYSGLEVLLSPRDAEAAEKLGEEFITKLLRACRRSYDYIILDLPSHMNGINLVALEESDYIYYVMTPNTPSLRIYKSVERLFARLNIHTENRMEILVNQKSRENEISLQDIKSFVDKPIKVEITKDERNVQKAVNMGLPLRKEQKEKKITSVAKDVRKWVAAVVE